MLPRMEKFVDVGDVTLFVRELGERTSKPSLVVMHGGPDVGHGYLLPGFEPLARDHHIVLFDFRGCGRSTRGLPEDDLQPEYVVQDTHRLIDKLVSARWTSWASPPAAGRRCSSWTNIQTRYDD
jgi:pimeloyl-ACP methyl ester carboxylesterase